MDKQSTNNVAQKFKLSIGQMSYIHSQLPPGFALRQYSQGRREQRISQQSQQSKSSIRVTVPEVFLNKLENLVSDSKKPNRTSKSFVKVNHQTTEEELFIKSPHFLPEEIRRCYVVFKLLESHKHFHQVKDLPEVEEIKKHLEEGPARYTSYHFWQEVTQLFRQVYKRHGFDSNDGYQTMLLENFFNEKFVYVLDESRAQKKKKTAKQLHDIYTNRIQRQAEKQLSNADIENIKEKLRNLPRERMTDLWRLFQEQIEPKPITYYCFEIEKLSPALYRKLDKFLNDKGKKKSQKAVTNQDSDSDAHASMNNFSSSKKALSNQNVNDESKQSEEVSD